ncbi:7420_t:CDS:2 [Funneliformis mosseae]|uniref:7420_t:CDS:1 n=1 Tax=Funneliformis mosseae TaxID=27381 RepID=A0A9N9FKT6_FUNMO|nr:7420_t:CDS:2 [Funneliformis mosseae]
MLFFNQSEEWSLLNFIKYLDSIESLRDSSELHRKYKNLNGIKNDENKSQKKRKRAEQCLVESDNPAIELVDTMMLGQVQNTTVELEGDEKRSPEIQEFWQQKKLQISLKEKTIKSTERMINYINTIQDEASDILILELEIILKMVDLRNSLMKTKRVPKPSSSPGVLKPFSSSLESTGSSAEIPSDINKINSLEPRILPHQIFSYNTSSGSSVYKEHGSKDDTFEDNLLMKSPVDITVDCKLIVKNMCIRSKNGAMASLIKIC